MKKSSSNTRSQKKRKKLFKAVKRFVLTPVLVCALMYAVIIAVGYPMMSDAVSIGSMLFQNNAPSFSREYENIFTPSDNTGDKVDASEVVYPSINKQFGKISIESADIDAKLFFGDGSVPLRNGGGVYAGSFIPGYGRTILATGHNNTYLNGLKKVKKGDIIQIRTSYGNYEYKIVKIAVKKADDKTAYDLSAKKENLILYTCYPFDELGLTEYRCFVYADKVSGPEIVGIYE